MCVYEIEILNLIQRKSNSKSQITTTNVPSFPIYRFLINWLSLPKDIDELDEVVDEDDSFLLISTLLLEVGEDSKEGEVGGGEHG